jgi:predicted nucleic acid-binding protein
MIGREVLVDSSAWIALGDASDQHHRAASDYFREISRGRLMLVTTNHVVAESYSLILRGAGHSRALVFLRSLRESNRLLRIYSSPDIEERAEEILARYSDHDFSFVDAVSFAVMRERGISAAFAFDRHFRTAGFGLLPDVLSA